jgi:RNA polymerase sigma-70 factor (ECF subfamily)
MSSSVARYVQRALGDTTLSNSGDQKSDSAAHPAKGEDTHQHSWEGLVTQTTSHDIADSDETLVALVRSGNREALAALFHRYARIVRGLAYRVLRDTSEADDLLQDIFLLVYRLCGTFDRSKGSARFWILQMTYRRAISRRRYLTSRHFYSHLDLDEEASQVGGQAGVEGPEAAMNETIDRTEALQNWFAEVSENQRQTLLLFFFEGYTFEEIAAKLGQTVGNARNHYYRGLEKLRKQISAANCRAKKQHDRKP